MDLVIQSLLEKFRQDRDLTALDEDDAFETFAGFCVLSSLYEDEFDPDVFRTGGGNDLGIDVFGVVINGDLLHNEADVREAVDHAKKLDVRVVIVQAKRSEKFETKVISDLADNLRHVLGAGELPYDASPDVENIRGCLRAIYDQQSLAKLAGQLPRIHVNYVTTGKQVARLVAQKASSAEGVLERIGRFGSVEVRCVTADDLRRLYQRATEAVHATVTMQKRFTLPPILGVEQAIHGLLAAPELVSKVLTDAEGGIRKMLFHDNVRDFLGYNEVNTKIRDTLRDRLRSQRFAVLNNGITIVTRELSVVGDELVMRDFQIVNGGQTCHVLFDQRTTLTDAVQVSVRIVHCQDDDVVDGIVAATNRQTAITEDDLAAREEFHRRLESFFPAATDKSRRLYYERRSKQYSEQPTVEKTRVISRAQLTRAYTAMFLDDPLGAGRYRDLVANRNHGLFQNGHHLIPYYTAAVAYYRLEWLIRNRRMDRTYRPALYHLLAAIGRGMPSPTAIQSLSPKAADAECNRILAILWDPDRAEKLVSELLPAFDQTIQMELATGVPRGEMVRNQRFADHIRAATQHK